ncbi:CAMP-dependent protein kinase regulatory subunit [Plakobranchus ocellatus]|uniref:cAMP-dependent protein kinase regulatory subunit n=1 Tax=Plakobranchus ocellatus TaxID=259542 RepID=A0AAV4D4C6_9GAST|nr:CAMP-dependent protein kinase regulatory subunit [Plakobranchus ocellatus]
MLATPIADRLFFDSSQSALVTALASPPDHDQTTAVSPKPLESCAQKTKNIRDLPFEYRKNDPAYLIEREKKIQISGLADGPSPSPSPHGENGFMGIISGESCQSAPSSKTSTSSMFKFPATPRTRKTGLSREQDLLKLIDGADELIRSPRACTSSTDSCWTIPSPRSPLLRRSQTLHSGLMASTPRINIMPGRMDNRKASLESIATKDVQLTSWQKRSSAASPYPECSSVASSPRHRKWSSTSSLERRNSAIERLFAGNNNSDVLLPSGFDSSGALRPRRRRISKKSSNGTITFNQTVLEASAPQALSRFRSVVRTVRIITGVCIALKSYEPRRIILREGHPPSAFYLVLSGSLIANISETSVITGQTFIRTVADVNEGECFGEIALLERTPRTASIVCKTRSELLVIYKEDFDKLILQPLIEQKKADVEYCA